MNKKKALVFAVGASLIILGLYSLYWAFMYQQSLNRNLAMLDKTVFPVPMQYQIIDELRRLIPEYTVMGFTSLVFGVIICVLPKMKVLAAVLLISMVAFTPMYASAEESSDRWFASLYLLQPRNSMGIQGNIQLYRNTLDLLQQKPVVNFRLALTRVDANKNDELIQIGFYQNRTQNGLEFWIYAEAILFDSYTLISWYQLSDIDGYIIFSIMQGATSNTFHLVYEKHMSSLGTEMLPAPETGGGTIILTVNFNIDGDNLFYAGSESTSPYNSLTGYYSNLVYYNQGWQPWATVNSDADSPYRVQMGSTDKFYTLGGLTRPITAGARSGGRLSPNNDMDT